ncbi:MAG: alpha/beta hydrolase [Mycobacterium sp.]
MALQIDPEVAAALAALAPATPTEPPPIGDIATRRVTARQIFERAAVFLPAVGGIEVQRFTMRTDDGTTIPLSWYWRAGTHRPGSAALYLHGGGMILGLDELGALYDTAVRRYVAASGVPMLVVDYRIAPEHPHPVPVNDCYAALLWLADHAAELEVEPARLAVVGDSAGGGLAAAVCLLARDRAGPPIAAQLLFYPMLDDRTTAFDPALAPLTTWTYDDNRTGWGALLGARDGGHEVREYAAPARAADLTGLPPAYLDVGDLDIFRDEDIEYARRLAGAGVPTEMHVHPGCPHAFEWLAPRADVSQRVIDDRVRRLRSL